ncbi:hypothetical protein B0H34DRAFT_622514, partial [Crassisporium funariophilum]
PTDYRLQLRRKLDKTHQNHKSVMKYILELKEILSMIGTLAKRSELLKVWDGLNDDIKEELW